MPASLRLHSADAEIMRLAVPALGALIAEPLFLLTDSAIIGHLGTPELAGLGIAAVVLSTLVNVSVFLAYGTTAAVARMLGAGDVAGSLRVGINGCWLASVIGVSTFLIGWPLTPWVVSLFGPEAAVANHAETYLRLSLLGVPSMLVVLAATGVLRGLQDTRTPLYVAVSGAISNIVLNMMLVYGLGMGIAGSALGTVVAQTAMAAVFVVVVGRAARRNGVPLRPHWPSVGRSFGTGIPLIVRTVAMRVALIVATAIATGMGTAELAAHQVVFNTWSLLALILDAIAIAAQALVGRTLGAGERAEARALTRRLIQWGLLTGFALAIIVLVVGSVYAKLFTTDPDVRSLIIGALIVAAAMQPVAGWVFVLDGILIGAGDRRYLAWASVVAVTVYLPAAWSIAAGNLTGTVGIMALWGAIGVWILARLVTLAVREHGDRWLVIGAGH